jgi:tetratricopeptide (TPR) repeat protein
MEGVDHYYKYYSAEAGENFEKALEFDTTFAMAYFWLALVKGEQGRYREQQKLMTKAVKYSDKVSWKEKRYIRSMEARISGNNTLAIEELQEILGKYPEEKQAFLWLGIMYWYSLGDPQGAVAQLTRAIEIDPLYKFPYNVLAYAYNDIGDFEKSIWAINEYISLAPQEANPYDSRADLYAYNGRLDQAVQSYRKALEIKPDFYTSLTKLGHMYLFKREYAKAESCYKELASSSGKGARSAGRTYLAYIPLYQGKFEEALQVLDDGIGADRMEQAEGGQNGHKHFLKAAIFEQKKSWDSALKEAEICREILEKAYPESPVNTRDSYAYLLAESGEITKAEEVALTLKKSIQEKNPALMYSCWLASGLIERAKGNAQSAVTHLEKAAKEAPSPLFQVRFFLARAYLESGRLGEAVTEFEKVLLRYDGIKARWAILAVKAHYLLGLAYERSGWDKRAIEKYEEFLEIWEDADPGIWEVEDAKVRLEKFKAQS